jgi:hypothetical protein
MLQRCSSTDVVILCFISSLNIYFQNMLIEFKITIIVIFVAHSFKRKSLWVFAFQHYRWTPRLLRGATPSSPEVSVYKSSVLDMLCRLSFIGFFLSLFRLVSGKLFCDKSGRSYFSVDVSIPRSLTCNN